MTRHAKKKRKAADGRPLQRLRPRTSWLYVARHGKRIADNGILPVVGIPAVAAKARTALQRPKKAAARFALAAAAARKTSCCEPVSITRNPDSFSRSLFCHRFIQHRSRSGAPAPGARGAAPPAAFSKQDDALNALPASSSGGAAPPGITIITVFRRRRLCVFGIFSTTGRRVRRRNSLRQPPRGALPGRGGNQRRRPPGLPRRIFRG